LGITITKGQQKIVVPKQPDDINSKPISLVSKISEVDVSNEQLKKIVQKVIAETVKPACENPVATHVKGKNVLVQPFSEAPPGQKINLVDVIDARVGNLASGFMTFEQAKLPWHLNYDEMDYVIEGEFVLEVSGKRVFRAIAGDVIYIPKGCNVVFSSPTYCKIFYVTYPANWAEFSK